MQQTTEPTHAPSAATSALRPRKGKRRARKSGFVMEHIALDGSAHRSGEAAERHNTRLARAGGVR